MVVSSNLGSLEPDDDKLLFEIDHRYYITESFPPQLSVWTYK